MQEGAPMFSMHLGSGERGGHVVVALRGELDLSDAAAVALALEAVAARTPRIIVDLAGLEFIDASGVAALARGRRHARNAGGDLLLAAPQRLVRRVLAIIWAADGCAVQPSVAAAASAGVSLQLVAPVQPGNVFPVDLAGTGRPIEKLQKERSSKMRWQRIALDAAPPRQFALTGAWLPRGSWTRRYRSSAAGGTSG
jgi:anti-sigma B factor antagonist